ncbi:MAG: methylated-DNA--[protein]-cysteine S-methyltransferase [Gammaproteobacteria bacterium]
MKTLHADRYASPLGDILMLVDDGKLCYLDFAGNESRLHKLLGARYGKFHIANAELRTLRARMNRYFDGAWDAFDGVALSTDGSVFQREVWRALREIPAGKTFSYQQLAQFIGKPRAVRAVGGANARNPIAVVIPCHRVIRADGKLGGYAGGSHGGIERKSWLLAHESARAA